MPRVRPEQLGWGLTQDLAITASGNHFVFDTNGDVYLNFKDVTGKSFSIQTTGSKIFEVKDDGTVSINGSLTVVGNINGNFSGSITTALTASHLEEQNVATFRPIETPSMFITGGLYRSSSGDWFLS